MNSKIIGQRLYHDGYYDMDKKSEGTTNLAPLYVFFKHTPDWTDDVKCTVYSIVAYYGGKMVNNFIFTDGKSFLRTMRLLVSIH